MNISGSWIPIEVILHIAQCDRETYIALVPVCRTTYNLLYNEDLFSSTFNIASGNASLATTETLTLVYNQHRTYYGSIHSITSSIIRRANKIEFLNIVVVPGDQYGRPLPLSTSYSVVNTLNIHLAKYLQKCKSLEQ
jgi:hypothetical protein